MKKILICGSRHYRSLENVLSFVAAQPPETVIISGGCSGADSLARIAAKKCGLEFQEFPAQWWLHGKAAGVIRNREMLAQNPDLVVAFHESIETSRGTKHMISIARKKGVPVSVFP